MYKAEFRYMGKIFNRSILRKTAYMTAQFVQFLLSRSEIFNSFCLFVSLLFFNKTAFFR